MQFSRALRSLSRVVACHPWHAPFGLPSQRVSASWLRLLVDWALGLFPPLCAAALYLIAWHTAALAGPPGETPDDKTSPFACIDNARPLAELESFYSTTRYELESGHGCSQSSTSSQAEGTLVLELSNGNARLEMHNERSKSFGPSLGAYRQGDTSFQHDFWVERFVWSGKAKPSKDGTLVLNFSALETAEAPQDFQNTTVLPAPSSSASALTLTCRAGCHSVYPELEKDRYMWNTDGESSEELPVLACVPNAELFELGALLLVDGALLFAPDPGLRLLGESASGFYPGSDRLVVRRAVHPAP
ncbi:MAG: hypothetical protein RBU37_25680 [Myxococcota bacterium]|jgi:hypothetical protein|nr:hypothetical protein [Myxococcota bacterium]